MCVCVWKRLTVFVSFFVWVYVCVWVCGSASVCVQLCVCVSNCMCASVCICQHYLMFDISLLHSRFQVLVRPDDRRNPRCHHIRWALTVIVPIVSLVVTSREHHMSDGHIFSHPSPEESLSFLLSKSFLFFIFLEYAPLKPKKRDNKENMMDSLFMAKKTRWALQYFFFDFILFFILFAEVGDKMALYSIFSIYLLHFYLDLFHSFTHSFFFLSFFFFFFFSSFFPLFSSCSYTFFHRGDNDEDDDEEEETDEKKAQVPTFFIFNW